VSFGGMGALTRAPIGVDARDAAVAGTLHAGGGRGRRSAASGSGGKCRSRYDGVSR
jgi:hypothetical protein